MMSERQELGASPSQTLDLSAVGRVAGLLVHSESTTIEFLEGRGEKFPTVRLSNSGIKKDEDGLLHSAKVSYNGGIDRCNRHTTSSPFLNPTVSIEHGRQAVRIPLLRGKPMVPDTERMTREMSDEEIELAVKLASGALTVLDLPQPS